MEYSKKIKSNEIRCFNIIHNERDNRFGLECKRLLLCKNSNQKAAGEIKCPRCGAYYEIIDNKIKLINH